MSKYWTLHVKDFAKIREASIEAAPLTLFVGDNNSGKSYLLSLLWGLTGGVDFSRQVSAVERKQSIKFDAVQNLLESWKIRDYSGGLAEKPSPPFWSPRSENTLPINAEEQSILTNGVNVFLAAVKNESVNEIFNTHEIHVGTICLDMPFQNNLNVCFQKHDGFGPAWGLTNGSRFSGFSERSALDFIDRYIEVALGESVFIPAPRTGFLLTFKTLARNSIRSTFSEEPKAGDSLTGPQVSYLERLTSLKKHTDSEKVKPSIKRIWDYVERAIVSGVIDITDTPLPEIRYKPEGLNQMLPLYLSSGVVAEVAGFLSLLKFGQFNRVCIYEEPEMCLHPALQWKMARVLVKLVNAGFKVWASTHSDIIIQHVNNMIKLSNYPDSEREQLQRERGYDEDDIIHSDKVRMYQFDVAPDHKTDVKPLECGQNGFRIPTFGKVFREMQDEVWNLRHEAKEAKL